MRRGHPNANIVTCHALPQADAWRRRQSFWTADHPAFDVVIIGGGIQGACVYHHLAREGRRVLLVEGGDFAGGTSQASAMLVWGGLLYLKNFDIAAVIRLCAARDRLIRRHSTQVNIQRMAFLFGKRPHHRRWVVHAALRLYWMLALGRRAFPNHAEHLLEGAFLRNTSDINCAYFEEGQLRLSDAQFVFDWIETAQGPAGNGMAQNYCKAVGGRFDVQSGCWKIDLLDTLSGCEMGIAARWIVNAAGVWVDRVNSQFGVESPWQHLLAKGASITLPRPAAHRDVLVFDDIGEREGMSLVPWGPVSLWGSTESLVGCPDAGWQAEPADVDFLLNSLNRHLAAPVKREDILALRCGVRPIIVRRGQTGGDPLSLSKRWRLWRDAHRPWISIYGGKLTACQTVAHYASRLLRPDLGRAPIKLDDARPRGEHEPEMNRVAGIEVPSAQWCMSHRACWTLEDYLRRRTNIAQWIPRGGLGRNDEHVPQLTDIARVFAAPEKPACVLVRDYRERIVAGHDRILGI